MPMARIFSILVQGLTMRRVLPYYGIGEALLWLAALDKFFSWLIRWRPLERALQGAGAVKHSLRARAVLNRTSRIGYMVQTVIMSTDKDSGSLANVHSGDVLISHPTAVREHEISIVPNQPHATSPTHDAAVSDARSEADAMGVDAWLTEDHTHVVKIASHRTPDK
jgi:hypothetical protein